MKKFLLILILTFSFQPLTKADDIRDFQIEGISIGDSLLDFININEIKKAEENSSFYPDKKYIVIFLNQESDLYDEIEITYKTKDRNYIIASINGIVLYSDNFNKCKKDKIKIVDEFKSTFKDANFKESEEPHSHDLNSFVDKSDFYLKTGGLARVVCTDWSEEMFTANGWEDNMKISTMGEKFNIYLSTVYD
jgi:hypothetical protein